MESAKHLVYIAIHIVVVAGLVAMSVAMLHLTLKAMLGKFLDTPQDRLTFGVVLAASIVAFAVVSAVAILPQY